MASDARKAYAEDMSTRDCLIDKAVVHAYVGELEAERDRLREALTKVGNALIDRLPSGHPDFAVVQEARDLLEAGG